MLPGTIVSTTGTDDFLSIFHSARYRTASGNRKNRDVLSTTSTVPATFDIDRHNEGMTGQDRRGDRIGEV
jgi:hypothetical protein